MKNLELAQRELHTVSESLYSLYEGLLGDDLHEVLAHLQHHCYWAENYLARIAGEQLHAEWLAQDKGEELDLEKLN